jgi:hypothetical protein
MELEMAKAEAQQGANMRNTLGQREFLQTQIEGARTAQAQAQANVNAGISGAVQGLGTAVDIYGKGLEAYKLQNKNNKNNTTTTTTVPNPQLNRGTVEIKPQMQQSGLTPEQMKYLSSFRYF